MRDVYVIDKEAVVITCDVCGKDMKDGDETYATGGGLVDALVDGHYPAEDGYYTMACADCGALISDFIASIEAERKGVK